MCGRYGRASGGKPSGWTQRSTAAARAASSAPCRPTQTTRGRARLGKTPRPVTATANGANGAAAARNGWAGVVVDGCVRDVAELAVCETGIRALASMPLPTERRNQGLRDVAVKIQGVTVRPGEWLYADEDGTVIADRPLHRGV